MKLGFYPRLAWNGITKNGRLYVPYLLTCVGMITMTYILSFLSSSPAVLNIHGALGSILNIGSMVMAVFAVIFLFYTNSFLVRRRNREFGLYNILGMGKGNIAHILVWETILTTIISLGFGIFFGVVLSKVAELGLMKIVESSATYSFSVSWESVRYTVIMYALIFVLIFLNSIRRVHFSNAIDLLHSENTGEKPPKGNWLFGLGGAIVLGIAYYLAVSIKEPLTAFATFFAAVVMVIVATYLIFIAGSVLLCRVLQKNKGYYYKPQHFVSVSSMVYRMKRNGAGLASICILATMVLVMISSTTCLYFGEEDSLRARYPRDINVAFYFDSLDKMTSQNLMLFRDKVADLLDRGYLADDNHYDIQPTNFIERRRASIYGVMEGDEINVDVRGISRFNAQTFENVMQVYFMPLEDYNALMNDNETLEPNEALIYTLRCNFEPDSVKIKGIDTNFKIKRKLDKFQSTGDAVASIVPTLFVIVPDFTTTVEPFMHLADFNGDRMMQLEWYYGFDTELDADGETALQFSITSVIRDVRDEVSFDYYSNDSMAYNRQDFYGMYGGLFFLGIMLSIVFISAAVLIIYYKQISEGYEDKSRFEIMQKVGMTKKDIRKSINSQLLTVFFMPIALAGLHLCFAFPFIDKIMTLFSFNNTPLLIGTTAISFAIFALLYTVIYRLTSNSYYKIIS
ncbi:MAG: ABC transporter permease [Clostridiales bacterium]|nr:ABC transporter permease [Clostridiales bacterium]